MVLPAVKQLTSTVGTRVTAAGRVTRRVPAEAKMIVDLAVHEVLDRGLDDRAGAHRVDHQQHRPRLDARRARPRSPAGKGLDHDLVGDSRSSSVLGAQVLGGAVGR